MATQSSPQAPSSNPQNQSPMTSQAPIRNQNEDHVTIERSREFSSVSKCMNFNLPIKLGKNNHIYWKAQVLAAIQALDLEDYVCGLNQPSIKFVSVQSINESGETIVEQKMSQEYNNWKRIDKLLISWIYSTISEGVIGQVIGCQTSFEVWNRLERLYPQQSIAKIASLRQQLQGIKKRIRLCG